MSPRLGLGGSGPEQGLAGSDPAAVPRSAPSCVTLDESPGEWTEEGRRCWEARSP